MNETTKKTLVSVGSAVAYSYFMWKMGQLTGVVQLAGATNEKLEDHNLDLRKITVPMLWSRLRGGSGQVEVELGTKTE